MTALDGVRPKLLTLLLLLASSTVLASPQSKLDKIKAEYQSVSAQLEPHIVNDWWIDDDPQSLTLLTQKWELAGRWVAGWFDVHPDPSPKSVEVALSELSPTEETGECLALGSDALLVVAPGNAGNVFIVAKSEGHWRLAWSTAQVQAAVGEPAKILSAWRPENARDHGRNTYWADSGPVSVIPHIEMLPDDTKGRSRFYIDGTYAQIAGGTVGKQISVWLWDGTTAHPLAVRSYAFMIDQAVGARFEDGLLKVQEKKSFRTFFSCGSCEERQTDWIVRVTPNGIKDLGERSLVPELDVVDELFDRLIKLKSAVDIASPKAMQTAAEIILEARSEHSEKEWREFPTLGMMGNWKLWMVPGGRYLCLATDGVGSMLIRLKSVNGGFFVRDLMRTDDSCER